MQVAQYTAAQFRETFSLLYTPNVFSFLFHTFSILTQTTIEKKPLLILNTGLNHIRLVAMTNQQAESVRRNIAVLRTQPFNQYTAKYLL